MGAHSTVYITRQDALREIRNKLDTLTDIQLAETMDAMFHDKLYNFMIVGEYNILSDGYSDYSQGMLD